jgi:hypothetical protein
MTGAAGWSIIKPPWLRDDIKVLTDFDVSKGSDNDPAFVHWFKLNKSPARLPGNRLLLVLGPDQFRSGNKRR